MYFFLKKRDRGLSAVFLNEDFNIHCSLGEVCSHVAAILFKIQAAVTLGITQRSSTSDACKWNNTFRENVSVPTLKIKLLSRHKSLSYLL